MTTTTWSFMDKWFTWDNEDGSASNKVVCPHCAPLFQDDPTARPLSNQEPDNNLECVTCGRVWE